MTEKRVFLDVIIEGDQGEVEEVIVPYKLSKEAVILEMKVQDIKVCGFKDGRKVNVYRLLSIT